MNPDRYEARTRSGTPTYALAIADTDGSFTIRDSDRTYATREFLVPDPYARGREIRIKATWDGSKWVVRDPGQAHDYGNEVTKYIYAPGPQAA
ncbi:MAG: hypothetical protein DHS20C01_24530 [marine bacterium B5-7]|nr:MAG: hypothetical protein DHS20C01_24530 [marine bacterium B5-7]